MDDFVLGERRQEPRTSGHALPPTFLIVAPGLRVTDIVDASASGVRLRTSVPLRPGRTLVLRRREDAQRPEQALVGLILRCWVQRLGRAGVTFEAALRLTPSS